MLNSLMFHDFWGLLRQFLAFLSLLTWTGSSLTFSVGVSSAGGVGVGASGREGGA